MTHGKTAPSGESPEKILADNRKFLERTHRKYGGPAEPLSEEERDRSETEIRNHLRRGASHSSKK